DLHRRGRDAGQDRPEGEGQRPAASDLLCPDEETGYEHVHAWLGRGDHRRPDHARAGPAQPERPGRQRLQLGRLRKPEARQADRRRPGGERRAEAEEDRGGRAPRAQRPDPSRAPAPAGDPVGDAAERTRRASRRQLGRDKPGAGRLSRPSPPKVGPTFLEKWVPAFAGTTIGLTTKRKIL